MNILEFFLCVYDVFLCEKFGSNPIFRIILNFLSYNYLKVFSHLIKFIFLESTFH